VKLKATDQILFDAGTLIREHPPKWRDGHKRLVFEIACSSDFPFEGELVYALWGEVELPAELTARSRFTVEEGVFEYPAPSESATVAWHLNFADPNLFVAYGSSLMAQDEIQVAEHPILGSMSEALTSMGKPPRTVDERQRPTPVTITGVQRRCAIDTRPNPAAGRPGGLYGNAFERAPSAHIRAATKPLSPPTTSNILAMAALPGGYGEYQREEIIYILSAAYAGFSAARQESDRMTSARSRTVIHTGYWGCGAFGGNRELMTILQALAAELAGVDVVFWAFDKPGVELAGAAHNWYERSRGIGLSVPNLVNEILRRKFQWGFSDGN